MKMTNDLPDLTPYPEQIPDSENPQMNAQLETMKDIGTLKIPDTIDHIHFLSIIGHIEGHSVSPPNQKSTKYEHIIPQLIAVERNPEIKGMLTILNTMGGDVEAGLAISEMISSLSKPTVSLVLGGSHSIGVPLATASDYSFIVQTATMTIHPIRMTGLVIGVPQTFQYFQKMQERIIQFIIRNSKVSRDVLIQLMNETDQIANDVGTILVGKEAVEIGLIDEVGGLNDAIAKLNQLIEENSKIPKEVSNPIKN